MKLIPLDLTDGATCLLRQQQNCWLIKDNAHYREVAFAELVAHRIQVRSPAANNDAGVTFCLHRKPILSSVEHIVGILRTLFTDVFHNTANKIDIINERLPSSTVRMYYNMSSS